MLVGQGSGRGDDFYLFAPGWVPGGASLDLDFVQNRGWRGRMDVAEDLADVGLTLVRPSGAFYFDEDRIMRMAANNELRLDHDPVTGAPRGALIEPRRTNYLRNNSNQGQVGTGLPTNWVATGATGLTTEVVGTGTLHGLPYTELLIKGTAATSQYLLFFDTETGIPSAEGQAWTLSAFVQLVEAPSPPTDYVLRLREQLGSTVQFNDVSVIVPTSEWKRFEWSKTLLNATATSLRPGFGMRYTSGQYVEVRIRVFPQLEQGDFVTSPIITSGSAATRAGDIVSCVVPDGGRAFAVDFDLRGPAAGLGSRRILDWNDGTASNGLWLILTGSGLLRLQCMSGGGAYGLATIPTPPVMGDRVLIYGVFSPEGMILGRVGGAESSVVVPSQFPEGINMMGIGGTGYSVNYNMALNTRRVVERSASGFISPAEGFAWARGVAEDWA